MRIVLFLSIFFSFLLAGNIDIPLDSPIYPQLERLKTLGIIKKSLPTLKPYNTQVVKSLIKSIDNSYPIKKELQKELKRYEISKIDEISLNFYYSDKENISLPNKEGKKLKKELNENIKLNMQYIGPQASTVFSPEVMDYKNIKGFRTNKAYIRFNTENINFTIGRESLWMGQGKEGTLLLSNNAKALDMIRISSIEPFSFHPYFHKWLYKIFGKMDFDFLVARLDKYDKIKREDGTIHSGYPKLIGIQFTFRPYKNFVLGLYKTSIFGGGGRSEDLKTISESIIPIGQTENTGTAKEAGDQIAGANLAWYMPNRFQPFKLYGEIAGEDSANNLPSKESYIVGVLFSDIFHISGLQTNYEYLHMNSKCHCWYKHHIYLDGYTNRHFIMGHFNGGEGKRGILRLKYLQGIKRDFTIAWDHFSYKEDINSFIFGFRNRINEHLEYKIDSRVNKNYSWVDFGIKWIF